MLRDALLVAAKDLRIERRSRVALNQVAPFAALVLMLFAFALEPDRGVLARAAAGLFWVAVSLASILAVQRSVTVEANDALRMAGLDPAGVFVGKAAALAVQLFLLEAVLAVGVVVLYDVELSGAGVLVPATVFATAALAASGSVYGLLAAGARARETLLPLLLVPVAAPVVLAATRAFESALAVTADDAAPWVRLLGVAAVVYAAVGMVAFGPLLEADA